MRLLTAALTALLVLPVPLAGQERSILFIGNSFTFGAGSAVQHYRAGTVVDLNEQGIGGAPALFKSFTEQAGLRYRVYLETHPGSGLEYHLENKLGIIGRRPWDIVVMHEQSTLDFEKPGDPAKLIEGARRMAAYLRARNPAVEISLMATWTRADQTYPPRGTWSGKPIEAMALDVRSAYDRAAAASGARAVIPAGEAWNRAFATGIADPNPYDGIEAGKIDLWTYDHYHASTYGYYLEALVVFGSVTGRDPRSLGETECSGYELGLSRAQVKALQQVAFDQLASAGPFAADPFVPPNPANPPVRCSSTP